MKFSITLSDRQVLCLRLLVKDYLTFKIQNPKQREIPIHIKCDAFNLILPESPRQRGRLPYSVVSDFLGITESSLRKWFVAENFLQEIHLFYDENGEIESVVPAAVHKAVQEYILQKRLKFGQVDDSTVQ